MRKLAILSLLSAAIVMLALAGTASGFEGGGRAPSEAPLIEPGTHYSGTLNNRQSDANFPETSSYGQEVAFWRLPPVSIRDTVTVNWHALPFTSSSGHYPVCLILVQGVDDFTWGETFRHQEECAQLPGSGSGQNTFTVQNNNSTSTFLEFVSNTSSYDSEENFPYDFNVEPPRHYLALLLSPVTEVAANGAIEGSVVNSLGLPAPDGLLFGVTLTWGKNGIANYTALTSNGHLAFPLALPESAVGQRVNVAVGRPADAQFQEAAARTSLKIAAPVVPPPPPPSRCDVVTGELLVMQRQLHRLRNHAKRVRGRAARRLRHRAHAVGQEVGKLKHRKHVVC